jgi:hypothetical protein
MYVCIISDAPRMYCLFSRLYSFIFELDPCTVLFLQSPPASLFPHLHNSFLLSYNYRHTLSPVKYLAMYVVVGDFLYDRHYLGLG